MCTMGNGCILEEDIPNIHKFAMDNWDETIDWMSRFHPFYHLQLFGLQSLSQIESSGFNAKSEVKALFGVSDHVNAEAFSHCCASTCWRVKWDHLVSVPFRKQADVVDLKALKDRVKAFTNLSQDVWRSLKFLASFTADDWFHWCRCVDCQLW